ncbi:trypsin-like peptidase domain-containing protein [Geobacter hydrogenophilus]|uniref:PDZ domain-containing protein n=1 Tax=Geobacter hydrogenophilus TaxID=40983 RepID=A0A9W6FXY4_9BACT|nr:trypsin-like peptidase domain-containing protein [Geobacter hydrogenophilus]MBT0895053.1 trypsin-like peptidase domain-containing protein [Geobacter hydrogenophilus]GLI36877.1 hypothetical protein GHYDROH2_03780 [Geobacter hydrogenophilus]
MFFNRMQKGNFMMNDLSGISRISSLAMAAALAVAGLSCDVLPVYAGHPGPVKQQVASVPDMLEQALPAIVTIGVFEGSDIGTAYGFASTASDIAYAKSLDLSGVQSSGSGFVVERGGKKYIVTNAHVIDDAADQSGSIAAFSINRTRYPVRVIGADSFYDVAVLEFTDRQPGTELSVIDFRKDEPRIGEQVFAIGNPLGDFPYTVTQGIIGGKNRVRGGMTGKFGYLQSSATTIWGNSGGPLIDAAGEVVGINTQIEIVERKFGTFVQPQLNFALESGIARRVVDDLIEQGRVVRAYMGLTLTNRVGKDKTVAETAHPRISGIVPGGPGAEALKGREGYALAKINGVTIRNVEEALGEFEKVRPGDRVTLELEENKERSQVSFVAGELSQRQHGELASYFLRSFASLDLKRGTDSVIIEPSPTCGDSNNPVSCGNRAVFAELDRKSDDYEELEGCHEDYRITAAGVVIGLKDDRYKVWRVRNLANLGLIIRLAALNGSVSVSGKVDDERSIVTMLLTDDGGETVLKTLIY